MPLSTLWKFWTQRKYKANKRKTADYIYFQWHFLTSNQNKANEDEETYKTYDVVDNIERTNPGVGSVSDVQSWLSIQHTEIYCDCCETSSFSSGSTWQESIYSVSSGPSRQDSLCSVSTSDYSECFQYSDISDDESLYSSQLRKKSRDIFMAV